MTSNIDLSKISLPDSLKEEDPIFFPDKVESPKNDENTTNNDFELPPQTKKEEDKLEDLARELLPGFDVLSKQKDTGKRFEGKIQPGEYCPLSKTNQKIDANLFDNIVFWCKERNASDIALRTGDYIRAESGGKWMRVSFRPITENEVENIIRTIVGDAAPGSLKRGNEVDRPYQPRDRHNNSHRFRMNITSCQHPLMDADGFEMILRSLPSEPPLPHEIGVEQTILDSYKVEKGLNLITGPTGSGKSTLLYSLVRHMMEFPGACDHVLDYSRPIEYTISNIELDSFISQMEVGRHIRDPDNNSEQAQWIRAVRNALRRKPNVIVIGETRDMPTFNASIQSSQSGHLTFTTMHTNSVPQTIQRSLRFFPQDERNGVGLDLMGVLNVVVCQRLFPHANGKRKVAVKEFMVFNNYVKSELIKIDIDNWPTWLYERMAVVETMDNPPFICQTMLAHAKRLLNNGDITEETFQKIKDEQLDFSVIKEIGEQQERDMPDSGISDNVQSFPPSKDV